MGTGNIASGSLLPALFMEVILGIAKAGIQLVFTSIFIFIIKILQYFHAYWLMFTVPSHRSI